MGSTKDTYEVNHAEPARQIRGCAVNERPAHEDPLGGAAYLLCAEVN